MNADNQPPLVRSASTVAKPCDCDVEITTEPPDGPPCCADVYWLRWLREYGVAVEPIAIRAEP